LDIVSELTGHMIRYYPDEGSLDSYPYPAFDLLSNIKYICILTSRRCPYHCSYCVSHKLNPTFRQRDPSKVVDEIEYWVKRLGVKVYTERSFKGNR